MTEHDPSQDRAADGALAPGDSAAGDAPVPGSSLDLLAAAARRDAAELQLHARVLADSLAAALPQDALSVRRRRSVGDRLSGRPGAVESLEVSLGDRRLTLTLATEPPRAEVATLVRGVVLSRREADLEEWVGELTAALTVRAQTDARARTALERLLLGD